MKPLCLILNVTLVDDINCSDKEEDSLDKNVLLNKKLGQHVYCDSKYISEFDLNENYTFYQTDY